MVKYSLDAQAGFTIEDYNRSKSFASFLPAIAGKFGIPLWSFYVNRGQGVAAFGIRDKNHSILEFLPANKAYGSVFERGFRTFLKVDSSFYEPFRLTSGTSIKQIMRVNSSFFEIEEDNKKIGLTTKVKYFTLPSQEFASLVRVVEIENTSKKAKDLELLDGLSYIVPYGSGDFFLKDLARTLEAWMDSFIKNDIAFFRLRVSPNDVAHTEYIKGANFYFSCFLDGPSPVFLKPVVDTFKVFAPDTGLVFPFTFATKAFDYPKNQILAGKTPCALGFARKKLRPKGSLRFVTFVGASDSEEQIRKFAKSLTKKKVEDAFKENVRLVEEVKNRSFVKSASSAFDPYVQQSYLDNVLRGGLPEDFSDGSSSCVHYIYSRKHGDLERDYNRFKLENSFLSQGEGNFRDVNQNRRCDVLFNPSLGRDNLYLFFNLQRPDGYNPLVVKPCQFLFESLEDFKVCFKDLLPADVLDGAGKLAGSEFSLQYFFAFLMEKKVDRKLWERAVSRLISSGHRVECAEFGEGFWVDHWTYNLDLIENYLAVFPDKEEDLFFERKYFFYDDSCIVNPRSKRFSLKDGKVTQQHFLHFDADKAHRVNSRKHFRHRARMKNKHEVLYTNLLVKLLVLVLNKTATLDPFGRGIEMEAGKPGWCDALNGLPALFGSSLPETFELKRLCLFFREKLKSYLDRHIALPCEVDAFFQGLLGLLKQARRSGYKDTGFFWDKASALKEDYRKQVFGGFEGQSKGISLMEVDDLLEEVIAKIDSGLATLDNDAKLPTYFVNNVTSYTQDEQGNLKDLKFSQRPLPLFLEGFVKAYKTWDRLKIKKTHASLKKGPLYDKLLKMYKINAPLDKEPLEIGRIRVFKPGWLENESIWLHMEYKYLLELLKAGLFDEFYKEAHNCFVCFLDPKEYGRSIIENSSFIVSSAYLDSDLWKRGFVARLSGSTVEVINMITLMSVGKAPFFVQENKLWLQFKPVLDKRLFTKKETKLKVFLDGKEKDMTIPKDSFAFKFLGDTIVILRNPKRLNTYSDKAKVISLKIRYRNAKEAAISSSKIPEPHSSKIRNREAESIEAVIG